MTSAEVICSVDSSSGSFTVAVILVGLFATGDRDILISFSWFTVMRKMVVNDEIFETAHRWSARHSN